MNSLPPGMFLRWVFRISDGQATTCLHNESNLMVVPVVDGRPARILYLYPVRMREADCELLFTSAPVYKVRDKGSPYYGMLRLVPEGTGTEEMRQVYEVGDPYITGGSDRDGVGMALRLGLSELGQEPLPFSSPELLLCSRSRERAQQGKAWRGTPTCHIPPSHVPVREYAGNLFGVPASRFTGSGVLCFNVDGFHGKWMHVPPPLTDLRSQLVGVKLKEEDFS